MHNPIAFHNSEVSQGARIHLFKVGMAEKNISPIFFFARISQSLEVILIPTCRFLLESSEAEISQCSRHVMPNT